MADENKENTSEQPLQEDTQKDAKDIKETTNEEDIEEGNINDFIEEDKEESEEVDE